MTSNSCFENGTATQLIRDVITAISINNKPPDYRSVFEYINKTSEYINNLFEYINKTNTSFY